MQKFGILVGRFQPLHLAHELIIREMMLDGRKPIVFVGSINKSDERNPLKFTDRRILLREVFPKGIDVLPLEDLDGNDHDWFAQIHKHMHYLGAIPQDTPVYFYTKDGDYDWSHAARAMGYYIKRPTALDTVMGFQFCSSDIRKDFEGHKHCLNPYVYNYIKNYRLL